MDNSIISQAKPIFIIGFPVSSENDRIETIAKGLEIKLNNEYHIITYKASDISSITFNVLNAVNATNIEIEDLIKLTNLEINRLTLELENSK